MPFAFLLLQSLFERFLFLFDSFVLLNEPINLCFELFNMIEGHVLAPETSRLSLVLSSCLVKPRFRRSTALKSQQNAKDRQTAALVTDKVVAQGPRKREFQVSTTFMPNQRKPRDRGFFRRNFYGCFGSAGSS